MKEEKRSSNSVLDLAAAIVVASIVSVWFAMTPDTIAAGLTGPVYAGILLAVAVLGGVVAYVTKSYSPWLVLIPVAAVAALPAGDIATVLFVYGFMLGGMLVIYVIVAGVTKLIMRIVGKKREA